MRVFCEKLHFNSLFLVNLSIFLWDFCVFSKMYHVRHFIVWKRGFKRSPDNMGFISNHNINAKNLHCLGFWKSLCMHKIKLAYACRKPHMQADSCVHIVRVSFALIFQKFIYSLIKSYTFHLNTSQVNSTSDYALNQPIRFFHVICIPWEGNRILFI